MENVQCHRLLYILALKINKLLLLLLLLLHKGGSQNDDCIWSL